MTEKSLQKLLEEHAAMNKLMENLEEQVAKYQT
jgi:hypothetical protein